MTQQPTQQDVPVTTTGSFEQEYGQQQQKGQQGQSQMGQGGQSQMGQQGQSRMGQGGQTQMGQGGQSQGGQTQMGQGGQSQMGQTQTGRQGQSRMGQGVTTQPKTLDDALTGEMRLALHDAVQAANITEWCADECISMGSPEMSECIRLCRDVADLASLNVKFISRGSLFGPDVAEAFAIAAEECARECSQHSHDHCQECARVLQRAVDSTWALLDRMSGQQQQYASSGV